MRNEIALCKQRLPLPDLLVRLRLFQNPPGPGSHPCPLHRERKGAAFSIRRSKGIWLWKCHGKCAASGDEISLLRVFEGTNNREAIQRYKELCGAPGGGRPAARKLLWKSPSTLHPLSHPMIQLPERLHSGAYADHEKVAQLRGVPISTITHMTRKGFIAFGVVCGAPSWIVLDAARKIAEARTLAGGLYPAAHGLSERKTHTLKGSQKNWPLGLTEGTEPILLVEGPEILWRRIIFAPSRGARLIPGRPSRCSEPR